MIDPLRLVAVVSAALLAGCDSILSKQEPAPQPAPVWTKSGSCSESYRCLEPRGVSQTLSRTSCPQNAHTWCREGAPCNPNDTTVCVRSSQTLEETSRQCSEERQNFGLFFYDVLSCSPTGTWRPAEPNPFSVPSTTTP
jgi:hypothetical protein